MKACFRYRTVAVLMAIVLSTSSLSVVAQGTTPASFNGRVMQQDGATPRPGIVVTLVDRATETLFDSVPTGDDGVFRIDSAPAGSYAVLARADEGVYVAASELSLVEGNNPPLQLTLKPQEGPVLAPGQSTGDDELPTWVKGLIAGVLVTAGYLLWDEITESNASTETPF
jgi:hypothetical protein